MARLFGTDGVRGIANDELTCELAYKIGQAGAVVLTQEAKHKPVILIGKDTRISSDMLEAALTAGICSVGADVTLLGVIPTPAVAYLTRKYNADAGIVISASHNPMEYNGIKIFNKDGLKLSDELEDHIESLIRQEDGIALKTGKDIGRVGCADTAAEDYTDFLCRTIQEDVSKIKIAVDCANGAAYHTADRLFSKLGADYTLFFNKPDGININDGCGSTHMEAISAIVKNKKFDIGIAFDGDADRCLLVDGEGNLIDGDQIIAACATHFKDKGVLSNDAVVVTVLSNIGFLKMAKENGIAVKTTKVGDRYVLEEMLKSGHCIGGEQSGHIIFSDFNTTGDGELTALQFLSVMKDKQKSAKEAAGVMQRFPQVMVNVKLKCASAKEKYKNDTDLMGKIKDVETMLGDNGRILVRPSGTENLIRVMAEGNEENVIKAYTQMIADEISLKFGI